MRLPVRGGGGLLTCAPLRRKNSPARRLAPLLREDNVLVDHRTYRIKPGMTQAHLAIYEKYGLAAQTRHLGPPIAP